MSAEIRGRAWNLEDIVVTGVKRIDRTSDPLHLPIAPIDSRLVSRAGTVTMDLRTGVKSDCWHDDPSDREKSTNDPRKSLTNRIPHDCVAGNLPRILRLGGLRSPPRRGALHGE